MKKHKLLLAAFAFVATLGVALGVTQGNAFAATKNWTGTVDADWSTSGNWSPSGAPTTGDDVIIGAGTPYAGTNDISGLSIKSLTLNNVTVSTDYPLTVTQSITGSGASRAFFGDIVLGGAVTITNVSLHTTLSPPVSGTGDRLNLNGNTVTFANTESESILTDIIGNGGVTVSVAAGELLYFDGTNTYTGTTTIVSGRATRNSITHDSSMGMFGTSSIIITPTGALLLDFHQTDNNGTFANPITIQNNGLSIENLYAQLSIWNNTSNTSAITINIPNITLEGNAYMDTNDANGPVTVNLAGIQANGFCVQYGYRNNQGAQFLNGPAGCIATPAAPATPDTGFQKVTNNPFIVLGSSVVAAAAIIFLARRYAKANV